MSATAAGPAGPSRRSCRPRLARVGALWGALVFSAVVSCGGGDGVRVEQSAAASAGPEGKASPLPATSASEDPGAGSDSPDTTPGPESDATPEPTSKSSESQSPSAPAVSPPGAQRELDVISLLRGDPSVSRTVKKVLEPCAGYWPVDVAYGRLTGVSASDVIVNVTSCADGKGLGSYVYRETPSGTYVNVFTEEQISVYAEIDKSSLRVYQQIYLDDDASCCPSGQDVVTYMWRGGKFAELDRVYKDLPKPTEDSGNSGED